MTLYITILDRIAPLSFSQPSYLAFLVSFPKVFGGARLNYITYIGVSLGFFDTMLLIAESGVLFALSHSQEMSPLPPYHDFPYHFSKKKYRSTIQTTRD
ncbi:hypothetical protein BU16DRAFT_78669 [Lophium mytilinum]|uniref:Uncharacterized protein n=1 Tax=Lophium mytilinum TaxID=390894 RepID=A0A6A6QM91_9PEZI|nr:hypothetical protein BU16DRAFT_78669 [Lophium mytilinum]